KFAALKERHGDDKQAIGKATMEIYKKEKVNPMSGCLPMIIQIPVFFALYYVLIESVQLRQAPFIFWIHDLSVKDPYYVLPILMGISMFVQQKMNPPPPDPTQAKMMMFLPVIFTVFFLSFPAGLVLYWLTNNCVQTLHQWYVMKTFDPKKEQYKQRQKKKKK
nr:membrane protein insertase YidC [Gammaproteobacteria bacterium]